MKKKDLIRLGVNLWLWYQHPPYILMIVELGKTVHLSFESKEEVNKYMDHLSKLKEYLEKEEEAL